MEGLVVFAALAAGAVLGWLMEWMAGPPSKDPGESET